MLSGTRFTSPPAARTCPDSRPDCQARRPCCASGSVVSAEFGGTEAGRTVSHGVGRGGAPGGGDVPGARPGTALWPDGDGDAGVHGAGEPDGAQVGAPRWRAPVRADQPPGLFDRAGRVAAG